MTVTDKTDTMIKPSTIFSYFLLEEGSANLFNNIDICEKFLKGLENSREKIKGCQFFEKKNIWSYKQFTS